MREASYGVTAVLASALALAPSAQAADDATALLIGNAGGLSGQVQLASAAFDAERRPVGRQIGSGDPIYQGDQIVTGPGGRVQLMLLDQTIITLGENARMTVDEISFGPTAADGKISVGVEQGAFRFISGQVAQAKPENVNIRIPMGNIGIRGTIVGGVITPSSILVALLGPGSQTDSSSTHGAIAVTTPGGSVNITRTGFSTVLVPGQPPSPPNPLTPAQLQLLTFVSPAQASAPTAQAVQPSGNGSAVSASTISGAATAAGLQLSNVVSTGSNSVLAGTTLNLVSTQTVAALEAAASRTLAESLGTPFALKFGTNVQILEDSCFCNTSPISHTYSLLTSDDGARSIAFSQSGLTLTGFGSTPIVMNASIYHHDTKIKDSLAVNNTFYDYREVPGLLYSAYGYLASSETSGMYVYSRYSAIGTGIPTQSVQMPRSGTATYTGATVGYISVGSGASGVSGSFTGTASLTANFATSTISGILSGLTPTSSLTSAGVTMGNITLGSALISRSGFSGGTATGTVTQSSTTTTSTGSFAGGFNGANAAEVAGTYAMNNASSQVSVVGSFGAKK